MYSKKQAKQSQLINDPSPGNFEYLETWADLTSSPPKEMTN